jgi:hypothetical protein
MKRFVDMMLGFFEHSGLVECEGMPSEVRAMVARGIEQFPKAGFAKMGRHFLDGQLVHPRTITDAAQRLLAEGDHWEGERNDWDAALAYVSRLDHIRTAMLALKEASASFDYQADELGLSPAVRNALFSAAIKQSSTT